MYQCKKYRYANLISWAFLLDCLALTDSCDSSEAKRISVTVPSNWPNVCEQFFKGKDDSNVNKSLSAGFRMDFNTKRAFIHIRCYVQTRSWDLSAFFFYSDFIIYFIFTKTNWREWELHYLCENKHVFKWKVSSLIGILSWIKLICHSQRCSYFFLCFYTTLLPKGTECSLNFTLTQQMVVFTQVSEWVLWQLIKTIWFNGGSFLVATKSFWD